MISYVLPASSRARLKSYSKIVAVVKCLKYNFLPSFVRETRTVAAANIRVLLYTYIAETADYSSGLRRVISE